VIYVIQYLRAIAAIMVVMSHIAFKSDLGGAGILHWFRIGASGVDVFFVISGFVMAMIYCRVTHGAAQGVHFWLKRLVRIFPLYWLVTSVALVLYLVNPALVNANGGPTSIWRSYTLVPTWQMDNVQFLIGPGWSLSFELYFYALFAVVFVVPVRRTGLVLAIAGLGILAAGSLSGLVVSYLITSPLLLEFAMGILVFVFFRRYERRIPLRFGLASLALGLVGFFYLNAPGAFVLEERWWRAGIPATLLVFGALSLEPWVAVSPSRFWLFLGDASYALYLTHVFALGAASRAFSMLHFKYYGTSLEVAFWLVTLMMAIGAGCLVHRYVERPLTRWVWVKVVALTTVAPSNE
jgi:exopolysaccharide production protein ExoZ